MDILIYGTGQFADYAHYVFEHDSPHHVIGRCIHKDFWDQSDSKYECYIFEELLNTFPDRNVGIHIAIGNNTVRREIYEELKTMGFSMPSYLSSKADFWPDLEHGQNVFLAEGSIIQPFVGIGDNCILMGAKVGHHCQIEDHCLLSGAFLGGNVKVGEGAFLGLNSCIQEGTQLGPNNVVGMNATVQKNTEAAAIFKSKNITRRSDANGDVLQKRIFKA